MGKGFARSRAQRFNWGKLVTPWTPKEFVLFCESNQKEILRKTGVSQSIAKDVPKIDWDHWRTQIKAPGVVDALQKEYESIKFTDVDVSALEPLKQANLKQISIAEAGLGSAKLELDAVNAMINKWTGFSTQGLKWTGADVANVIPGGEAALKEQFEDEEYLPTEEEERIASLDFSQLEAEMLAGTLESTPTNDKIGDLSFDEELEVINRGEWTVSRLLADKEQRAVLSAKVAQANAAAASASTAASN